MSVFKSKLALCREKEGKINLFKSLRRSTHVTSLTALVLAAILIITSMVVFPKASVTAQLVTGNNSVTNMTSILNATTIFQNDVDGFRVGVPEGWVVEDIDSTDPAERRYEKSLGIGKL